MVNWDGEKNLTEQILKQWEEGLENEVKGQLTDSPGGNAYLTGWLKLSTVLRLQKRRYPLHISY